MISLDGPVAAPVIAFHSWAECAGAIVPERVGVDAIALRCSECGRTVGIVEPGLFENWGIGAETLAAFAAAAAGATIRSSTLPSRTA